GIVPAILVAVDSGRVAGTAAGWPLIALGLGVLLRCVRDFYTSGNGTLAPWDPPQRLVITGLYRYVRNPMYLAIVVYLTGWAMAAGSPLLGGYAVASAIAFHLRVLVSEEPWLAAQFPTEWQQYQEH